MQLITPAAYLYMYMLLKQLVVITVVTVTVMSAWPQVGIVEALEYFVGVVARYLGCIVVTCSVQP